MTKKDPLLRVLSYVMTVLYIPAFFIALALAVSLVTDRDWSDADKQTNLILFLISGGCFLAAWLIDRYGRSESGGRKDWWRDF